MPADCLLRMNSWLCVVLVVLCASVYDDNVEIVRLWRLLAPIRVNYYCVSTFGLFGGQLWELRTTSIIGGYLRYVERHHQWY